MERYFPTIKHNESLCNKLGCEISEGRFPHAYIISGKKGSGKKTLALNIAAALACKNRHTLPCGECDDCKKILSGYSPDVIFVRKEADKKEFTINLIREIKESLYIAPNELEKRVYILEDAETINVNAQNAFLKMLEEPPSYVVFLLLCSNTQNLLETIKSRAPILNMEHIPAEEIREYLLENSVSAREIENADAEKLKAISLAADGSIGAALTLCDDNGEHTLIRNTVVSFLEAWTAPTLLELDLFGDSISSSADFLTEFLKQLKIALRDVCISKYSADSDFLFFGSSELADEFSAKITVKKALSLIESADALIDKLKFYLDTRLAAVSFCSDARKIMIG